MTNIDKAVGRVKEALGALTGNKRLKDDGLDVDAPSQQHGAWSFSFLAPGGFTIVIRSEVDWQAGEAEEKAAGSHRHRH